MALFFTDMADNQRTAGQCPALLAVSAISLTLRSTGAVAMQQSLTGPKTSAKTFVRTANISTALSSASSLGAPCSPARTSPNRLSLCNAGAALAALQTKR